MSGTEPEPELRDTSGWSVGVVSATCALASGPRCVRTAAFTPAIWSLEGAGGWMSQPPPGGCTGVREVGAVGSGTDGTGEVLT